MNEFLAEKKNFTTKCFISLRSPTENEIPSPQPSPSGLGEGVFAPKNFCLTLARFCGRGEGEGLNSAPQFSKKITKRTEDNYISLVVRLRVLRGELLFLLIFLF